MISLGTRGAALGAALLVLATSPTVAANPIDEGSVMLRFDPEEVSFLDFEWRSLNRLLCSRAPGLAAREGEIPPWLEPVEEGIDLLSRSDLLRRDGDELDLSDLASVVIRPGDAGKIWPPELPGDYDPLPDRQLRLTLRNPAVIPGTTDIRAELQPTRICTGSAQTIYVFCGPWRYTARLADGPQPIGQIELSTAGGDGGTYHGNLETNLELTFTHRWTGRKVVHEQPVSFQIDGLWASTPGPGAIQEPSEFAADTDCDGIDDTSLPPTSPFYLGWSDTDGDGVPDPVPFCAEGRRGTGSICVRPQTDAAVPGTGPGIASSREN